MTTFNEAAAYAKKPMEVVASTMQTMLDHATVTYDKALGAISDLKGQIALPTYSEPAVPDNQFAAQWTGGGTAVSKPVLENVGSLNPDVVPSIDNLKMEDAGPTPVWNKPAVTLDMPATPPAMDLTGLPDKPLVNWAVDLPDQPSLSEPLLEPLDTISIPTFAGITLPTFNGLPPTLDVAPPSIIANWTEPEYVPEILPEIKASIVEMLHGRGLPASLERALFERAREREIQTAQTTIDQAFDTWAARGFTLPPGALVEQVNAAQQQMALAQNTLSRDIMTKAWDLANENMKFGVIQGMAYEGLLMNLFNNMVQRTFDMARLRVEMEAKMYDMAVTAFNARVESFKISADAYRVQLEGELAKVKVFEAQLQGEQTKSNVNMSKAQVYANRVQALTSRVEAYKAELQAAMIPIEIAKSRIDGYKAEISAWAERIGGQKASYDAYATRVGAETAKIKMFEASASAFSAEVNAYSTTVGAKAKKVESEVAVFDAKIKGYMAKLDAQKVNIETSVTKNKNLIDMYGVEAGVYRTTGEMAIQSSRVYNEVQKMRLDNNLGLFNAHMKKWEVQMANFFKQQEINKSALQSVAQASSAIAQGALSAISTQASMQGQGSVSAQYQESFQTSSRA